MEPCEIIMTNNKQGYPRKGKELTVGRERAYRWVNVLKIAAFKSPKERKISDRSKRDS